MNIDIRQLRYFQAVADERSFTRGAARLNMAQPPLSRRIQELEAEIGAPLFERDRRPLRLTPVGQILYEQASLVTEAMERLKAAMHGATAKPRTRFVMGLVPSTLYARFPEIMHRFRLRAPDIDLRLAEMDTSEQIAALADGRIDVGFDRIVAADAGLRHEKLRDERLVVAMPADDPLLLDGKPLPLSVLASRPLLLYPRKPRPSYADIVLQAVRAHAVSAVSVIEVRELQTALVMVASGAGYCIVPESVRRLARPDIGFAPILEPLFVPLLIRFRRHDTSPALRLFIAVYTELYAEWGWPLPTTLTALSNGA